MSSGGPPRPPGMPAYPQPPGGARMPPMPPKLKTAGGPPMPPGAPPMPPGAPRYPQPPTGAAPMPPGGPRYPQPPTGGPPMPPGAPPMPPGAPRYPQPPTGAPPMPPGMTGRARTAPVRGEQGDPSAYDPTQGPAPPSGHNAYPAPPSGHNAYPVPPSGHNGQPRDEPHYLGGGGGGMYGGSYEEDGRRARSSRYGGGDDDGYRRGGGRHGRGDRDRRRDDRGAGGGAHYGRQGGQRSLVPPPPPREPTNTVWVANVDPYEHPDGRIIDTFKEFGMVMRLAKHFDKGFCFVHFRTIDEARRAVETLAQRDTLHPAVYSYGKMFDYSPEEMALPFNPNHVPVVEENGPRGMDPGSDPVPGMRRGRDPENDEERHAEGGRPERRRGRGEPLPPTNVLWVGSLPPFVTSSTLQDLFSPFGNITRITRMDKNNIAFVHFETIDECTLALNTMSGRPIEGGAVLALNYGHQPRQSDRGAGGEGGAGAPLELTPDGFPVNEARTNAIYIGQIPDDATEEEVAKLYASFEGYINCRYVPTNGIAFGHYDTVEHALAARIGLHGQLIRGTPVRVMFGKNNHSYTLADRDRGDGAPSVNADGTMIVSNASVGGAMTALPARGGGVGVGVGGADGATTAGAPVSAYTRTRPAPVETLESRLQTLLSVPYNQCGASGAEISPSQIDGLCHVVDYCVDEKSAADLDQTVGLYLPSKATHVFNVVAKRMLEYFKDDPHKRLLVLYATTRAMLGAPTSETEATVYNEAALNAYLMVLMVASENQTPSGLDRSTSVLESLRHHSFLTAKCRVNQTYAEEFGKHLDDMMERIKAEQDLASLLSAGKGL